MMKLKGQVAMITGAGRNIGKAMAKLFASEGGRIAGAGFDVYPKEPLPKDHPLRSLPNVIMQPHMGGYTEEGYGWKFIPAVENIIAFIEGRPQNLATDKDIERQRRREATYLT
jgi:D-3-phosphoglycerate dehydrogenase